MDLGISQTTVARAREKLAEKFFPKDATTPKFYDTVSEVIERYHALSAWVGSKSTFSIAVPSDGHLFLPYFLDSIMAVRIDTTPTIPRGVRHEFLYDGPGELDEETGCTGDVVDQGLSAIEAVFPNVDGTPTAGVLRFTATAADAGKKIRVLGYTSAGRVLTDGVPGEEVTLVDGTVDTTNSFIAIQGFQKEVTKTAITVHHVGGSNTLLATLESFMELPLFRHYKVLAVGSEQITAHCKRRPVPVTQEEDYIIPGNLAALKLGLYAINYEEKNDMKTAMSYWGQATDILNGEATEYVGGAQEAPAGFSPWGVGVSGIKRMN